MLKNQSFVPTILFYENTRLIYSQNLRTNFKNNPSLGRRTKSQIFK